VGKEKGEKILKMGLTMYDEKRIAIPLKY